MPFKTYYERLGVAVDASQDDIKTAYRKLAQELHPDKLPDDISPKMAELATKEFNELREAYLVLSNASARATYDRRLLERDQPDSTTTPTAERKQEASGRIPKRWQIPLVAGAIGAACAIIAVSIVNAVASINRQPVPQANASSSPPSLTTTDEPTEGTADNAIASNPAIEVNPSEAVEETGNTGASSSSTDSSQSSSESAVETVADSEFTPGEITRFATALLELQPILNSTKANLEAAGSPTERQEIENSFDVRATEILLSHGLQPDEYQRIAARTETDSKVRLEVITATVRLQQLGRYQ